MSTENTSTTSTIKTYRFNLNSSGMYALKNGKACIFVKHLYSTSLEEEIKELDALVNKGDGAVSHADEQQATVVTGIDVMQQLRQQVREEMERELKGITMPESSAPVTALKPASTVDMAAVAAASAINNQGNTVKK